MQKVLIAGVGALLLTTAFTSEASAQRRAFGGGGFHGFGGPRIGLAGAGFRTAGLGWRGGWRGRNIAFAGGWGGWGGNGWAWRRPYRPLLWGAAAALGTVAAISAYDSYAGYYDDPYYSYGYSSYGPGYISVSYGCSLSPQWVWNGWRYRQVWARSC